MARGSATFSRSLMKTRLPSDLLIFSPSYATIAECSQCRTNGLPVRASLCATSHSWCGKIRSVPPPCRSRVGPSSCMDMAEHSMCHPGRPTPNGARHAGSSASDGCQRTKSRGSRRCGSSGLPPRARARRTICSREYCDSLPKFGAVEMSKYAVPLVRYAWSESSNRSTIDTISSIVSVARGSAIGGRIPSASMSAWKRVSSASASSRYGMPSSRALGRMESSTSVTLRTMRTSCPSSSRRRVRMS